MAFYLVESGNLRAIIEADNHNEAIKKAIIERSPDTLGALIGCWQDGDDEGETQYVESVAFLKRIGQTVKDEC
jgi:hypothetical protein